MRIFNEEQLPHVTSHVESFLVDLHGNAEGMMLGNGVEVSFRPHLSVEVLSAVHVGDRITVYGLLPKPAPVISAAVIETASGGRIADDEPLM